jgi:hypothetical protein
MRQIAVVGLIVFAGCSTRGIATPPQIDPMRDAGTVQGWRDADNEATGISLLLSVLVAGAAPLAASAFDDEATDLHLIGAGGIGIVLGTMSGRFAPSTARAESAALHGPAYRDAWQTAFEDRLLERQTMYGLLGGILGAAIGLFAVR